MFRMAAMLYFAFHKNTLQKVSGLSELRCLMSLQDAKVRVAIVARTSQILAPAVLLLLVKTIFEIMMLGRSGMT